MYQNLPSIFKNTCRIKPIVQRCISTVNQNITVDEDLAKRLETVSLVGFSKRTGFELLSASVDFADRITRLDTAKVQPLITVLENWYVTI